MKSENTDLLSIQSNLLNRSRRNLLVKIAKFEIKTIVGIATEAGCINPYNESKIEKLSSVNKVHSKLIYNEFSIREENRSNFGVTNKDGKVNFAYLGGILHDHRDALGIEFDEDFYARSQRLPYLYGIFRGQRNLVEHRESSGPNQEELITLFGAILSVLALSSPEHDEVKTEINGYKEDVDKFMKILTGDVSGADDLQGENEELEKENEELNNKLNEEREAKRRLERQLDRETSNESKMLKSLDDSSDRTIEKISELAEKIEASQDVIIPKRMMKEIGEINSKLISLEETVQTESRKVIDRVSETVDSDIEDEEDYQVDEDDDDSLEESEEESENEDSEMLDADVFREILRESRIEEGANDERGGELTPLMAEAKLRALRSKIRREMDVPIDPWQNICMIRPIVSEALIAAQYGGMNTIDDWKSIPNIARKYRRHQGIMDRQLAKYGEEMMDIYRSVERRYVDND